MSDQSTAPVPPVPAHSAGDVHGKPCGHCGVEIDATTDFWQVVQTGPKAWEPMHLSPRPCAIEFKVAMLDQKVATAMTRTGGQLVAPQAPISREKFVEENKADLLLILQKWTRNGDVQLQLGAAQEALATARELGDAGHVERARMAVESLLPTAKHASDELERALLLALDGIFTRIYGPEAQ